jgi:hypothetical protein
MIIHRSSKAKASEEASLASSARENAEDKQAKHPLPENSKYEMLQNSKLGNKPSTLLDH